MLWSGVKLGGSNRTVEHESVFGRPKKTENYKAGSGRTYWVVGGICRENGHTFYEHVRNRDRKTLRRVIIKYVEAGSLIQTDSWQAYDLRGLPYLHRKIYHRKYFIDPLNPENHTQNIENHWAVLKKGMRRRLDQVTKKAFERVRLEWM